MSVKKRKPGAQSKGAAKASAKRMPEASEASRQIDQRIRDLGDWRGETLAHMRSLILAAPSSASASPTRRW